MRPKLCQNQAKKARSKRHTLSSVFPVKYRYAHCREGRFAVKPSPTDMRDMPAYSVKEAAKYLKLPPATLRDWVVGRSYSDGRKKFAPLIKPATAPPPLLSFHNLIEAHILRSLRIDHSVAIKEVRKAIAFAESTLHIERLLLSQDMLAGAGKLFLEKYGELIELSNSGQLAIKHALEAHLHRVKYDSMRVPIRLFPFISSTAPTEDQPIAIDPKLAFGRPIVFRKAISTLAIVNRIDAGEDVEEIAADYDLEKREVEQAMFYERAA